MTTANNPVVTAVDRSLILAIDKLRTDLGEHDGGRSECVHCRIFDHINAAYGEAIGEPIAMTQASPPPDEMVERVARAICEQQIRRARRWDTEPDELEAMMAEAVDYSWTDHVDDARAALQSIGPMRGWDEVVSFIVKIPAQRGWIRWQKRSGLIRQLDDARAVAEEAAKHHGHARIVERRSLISETQIETLSALKRIEDQG